MSQAPLGPFFFGAPSTQELLSWAYHFDFTRPAAPARGWAAQNDEGFALLHILAFAESDYGWEQAKGYLSAQAALRAGAPRDAQAGEVGQTPLHWCVWQAAPGCALALLEAGADPLEGNRMGESALDLLRRLQAMERAPPARLARIQRLELAFTSHSERQRLLLCLQPSRPSAPCAEVFPSAERGRL